MYYQAKRRKIFSSFPSTTVEGSERSFVPRDRSPPRPLDDPRTTEEVPLFRTASSNRVLSPIPYSPEHLRESELEASGLLHQIWSPGDWGPGAWDVDAAGNRFGINTSYNISSTTPCFTQHDKDASIMTNLVRSHRLPNLQHKPGAGAKRGESRPKRSSREALSPLKFPPQHSRDQKDPRDQQPLGGPGVVRDRVNSDFGRGHQQHRKRSGQSPSHAAKVQTNMLRNRRAGAPGLSHINGSTHGSSVHGLIRKSESSLMSCNSTASTTCSSTGNLLTTGSLNVSGRIVSLGQRAGPARGPADGVGGPATSAPNTTNGVNVVAAGASSASVPQHDGGTSIMTRAGDGGPLNVSLQRGGNGVGLVSSTHNSPTEEPEVPPLLRRLGGGRRAAPRTRAATGAPDGSSVNGSSVGSICVDDLEHAAEGSDEHFREQQRFREQCVQQCAHLRAAPSSTTAQRAQKSYLQTAGVVRAQRGAGLEPMTTAHVIRPHQQAGWGPVQVHHYASMYGAAGAPNGAAGAGAIVHYQHHGPIPQHVPIPQHHPPGAGPTTSSLIQGGPPPPPGQQLVHRNHNNNDLQNASFHSLNNEPSFHSSQTEDGAGAEEPPPSFKRGAADKSFPSGASTVSSAGGQSCSSSSNGASTLKKSKSRKRSLSPVGEKVPAFEYDRPIFEYLKQEESGVVLNNADELTRKSCDRMLTSGVGLNLYCHRSSTQSRGAGASVPPHSPVVLVLVRQSSSTQSRGAGVGVQQGGWEQVLFYQ